MNETDESVLEDEEEERGRDTESKRASELTFVSSENDSGLPIGVDLLVESSVVHLLQKDAPKENEERSALFSRTRKTREEKTHHIEIGPSVVLSKLYSSRMPLKDLLNELCDGALPSVGSLVVPSDPLLVLREPPLDRIREDGDSIGSLVDVVLDVLDVPPRSVSTVVPRSST